METKEAITTEVNDIGFAAYLRVVKKIDYACNPELVQEGRAKYVFTFKCDEDFRKQSYIDYMNSEYRTFDTEVKQLKRLLYSKN